MGWFSKKKDNGKVDSFKDDNTYVCEVGGSYGHLGYKTAKFTIQLGSQDYYEISSDPFGEAARDLGLRLCPAMTEFHRVYITKP